MFEIVVLYLLSHKCICIIFLPQNTCYTRVRGGSNNIAIIFRSAPLCIIISVTYHGSRRFFISLVIYIKISVVPVCLSHNYSI